MADLDARRTTVGRDPWVIPLALLGLACFAPFVAQHFGWLHSDAIQRDAALVLPSGVLLVLLGGSLLFGRRRWPVSSRPKDVFALAFLGLNVAMGIISIVTGAGVLLGALAALPFGGLVFQVAFPTMYITTLLLRP